MNDDVMVFKATYVPQEVIFSIPKIRGVEIIRTKEAVYAGDSVRVYFSARPKSKIYIGTPSTMTGDHIKIELNPHTRIAHQRERQMDIDNALYSLQTLDPEVVFSTYVCPVNLYRFDGEGGKPKTIKIPAYSTERMKIGDIVEILDGKVRFQRMSG